MNLLQRFTLASVPVLESDLPQRSAGAAYAQCPHCGRFGAFVTGCNYTLVHRTHCVIAEGLRAQQDLDAARFQADNQLTEFTRAYNGFERLDAELRGEFVPPGATTIVRRDAVLAS